MAFAAAKLPGGKADSRSRGAFPDLPATILNVLYGNLPQEVNTMSSFRRNCVRCPEVLASWLPALLVAGTFCLIVGGASARAETQLRWKFSAGEQLQQKMNQQMNVEMKLGETPIRPRCPSRCFSLGVSAKWTTQAPP
ncbi:MAG: hypothetical protein R3C10_06345 [Pirellulales bacterium]